MYTESDDDMSRPSSLRPGHTCPEAVFQTREEYEDQDDCEIGLTHNSHSIVAIVEIFMILFLLLGSAPGQPLY